MIPAKTRIPTTTQTPAHDRFAAMPLFYRARIPQHENRTDTASISKPYTIKIVFPLQPKRVNKERPHGGG